jgi:hypothetical protein
VLVKGAKRGERMVPITPRRRGKGKSGKLSRTGRVLSVCVVMIALGALVSGTQAVAEPANRSGSSADGDGSSVGIAGELRPTNPTVRTSVPVPRAGEVTVLRMIVHSMSKPKLRLQALAGPASAQLTVVGGLNASGHTGAVRRVRGHGGPHCRGSGAKNVAGAAVIDVTGGNWRSSARRSERSRLAFLAKCAPEWT